MKTLAIAMAKGGVGKTTTAVNLAYGLAESGQKVLLVDTDTQDQVSKFLGIEPSYGLYEFITGTDNQGNPVSKMDTIFPARKNLWVLSGGLRLVSLKNWLSDQPAAERDRILAEKLKPREGSLDYIIYDCSPGWDSLSVNILMAAQEVLCPVSLQGAAVAGLKTYLGYLKSAQKLNPELRLKYILPTMYDKRTKQSVEIMDQLEAAFSGKVCEPIRMNVRVSESPSHGLTVFEYADKSAGAEDYKKLIDRILRNGGE